MRYKVGTTEEQAPGHPQRREGEGGIDAQQHNVN